MPISPDPRSQRPRRCAVASGLIAVLAMATVLAGCAAYDGTAPPDSGSPGASVTPAATPSATPDLTFLPTDPATTPVPTPPGQTDTPWGRIWDGLPSQFPTYPGAHPTTTDGAPTSATLDAGTSDPAAVVNAYQAALEAAGYMTVGLSGPMEDGSRQLTSVVFQSECQVQTTATPLGASTIITILYGAACPFRN